MQPMMSLVLPTFTNTWNISTRQQSHLPFDRNYIGGLYKNKMLPCDDILYTICDYLSYTDYLSYSMTLFQPVLKISRSKRFEWCRSRVSIPLELKCGWCSDVTCERQRMSCIELEPILKSRILSNYCAIHTRQYFTVDSLLELLQP